MQNKKDNRLLNHKFTSSVLKKASKIIDKQKIEKGKDGKIKPCRDKLSAKEKYIMDTFQRLNELISTFEQIENIKTYLKQFPSNKSYKNFKITRDIYLRYHIENYFIRSVSLSDKLAFLINQVYDIGLNYKDVKLEVLLRTDTLQNTHLSRVVKYYESKIHNKIKSIRNSIIHRIKYSDEKLDILSAYSLINSTCGEERIPKLVYKISYKFYIGGWIKNINQHLQILVTYFDILFKQLNKVFETTLLRKYEPLLIFEK